MPRALVSHEIEQLVLNDRAADAAAELIQAQRLLRIRFLVEPVASVKILIAAEVVGGAMNCVGAGLQAEVYDCAGLPAIFR